MGTQDTKFLSVLLWELCLHFLIYTMHVLDQRISKFLTTFDILLFYYINEIISYRNITYSCLIIKRLPVSHPTYKEFGNHLSHSHKKNKTQQTENHQLFSGPSENGGHKANYRPTEETGGYRESLLPGTEVCR